MINRSSLALADKIMNLREQTFPTFLMLMAPIRGQADPFIIPKILLYLRPSQDPSNPAHGQHKPSKCPAQAQHKPSTRPAQDQQTPSTSPAQAQHKPSTMQQRDGKCFPRAFIVNTDVKIRV